VDVPYTAGCFARGEIDLRIVVKHEERAHAFIAHLVAARKKIVNPETVAYHMWWWRWQYLLHLFGSHCK
jgi:hypothetical protein